MPCLVMTDPTGKALGSESMSSLLSLDRGAESGVDERGVGTVDVEVYRGLRFDLAQVCRNVVDMR